MQKLTILFLLAFSCTYLNAQTNLDSLYTIWEDRAKPDSIRVNAYYEYIWDGFLYKKPDSAFTLAKELVVYAKKKQYLKAEALAYRLQGVSLKIRGNYLYQGLFFLFFRETRQ